MAEVIDKPKQETPPKQPEAPKKRQPVCMPERCGLAMDKRNDWVIDAEASVQPEDLLEPAYWSHMAPSFSAFDTIEVRAEDGRWIVKLRVLFAERNYAKVKMEGQPFFVEENAASDQSAAKHFVDFKGPHHKYVVIRRSDSALIKSGCKTREEATAWMIEHERSQTR